MRIFQLEISEEAGEACAAVRVEVSRARTEFPEKLWFRFPRHYLSQISQDMNAFATALLPLAMYLGEDLHVEGALSPRLLQGLNEYQLIQSGWLPNPFRPITIHCEQLQASKATSEQDAVACSFSGGVDSFHTLRRHLAENEPIPGFRITHCLMINGFDADTDMDNSGSFSKIRQSIGSAIEGRGLELIVCRSNYMSFSDPNILKLTFAAMLAAPALALGGLFSYFFIPTSYRFDKFFRDGSHLMMDHLISTESMQTIHDSAHLDRPQRTAAIADWDAAHRALRVCFNATSFNDDSNTIINCCRCEKCIRTMKTLEILGRLGDFETFPRRAGHAAVWSCYYGDKGARIHGMEVMKLAWQHQKWSICLDYGIAMVLSMITKWPRAGLQKMHIFLEERSEAYASNIRRLFPSLRRRAYWIR